MVLLSIVHAQLTHQCSSDPFLYLTACSWSYRTTHAGRFWAFQMLSRVYQYWLLSLASFKISRDLVHCNCKECPGSFLQETIPAVLSLPILLSFIDKHKLTPVFITDVKLSGFAVFSDTMTLLPNTLLKQFIKQFFQSTLPPLQLKYMLVVIEVLKIQFECWPVLYYSVFF